MKTNTLSFLIDNFFNLLFISVFLGIFFYFFGSSMTLNFKNKTKQTDKQSYTYFFKQDILFHNINTLIFLAIVLIIFLINWLFLDGHE